MTRRQGRVGRRALLALAPLGLAGCGSSMGLPESATSQGEAVTDLWRIFLVGAVIVAGLIWVLVLVSILRFRTRGGDGETEPVQRQYRTKFEIFYTAVPLVVVLVLFALTLVANDDLTSTKAEPEVTVEVIGFQWQWQFRYADDDVVISGTPEELPELVLPVGETVRFELVADDVIHSFWVPEFLEKRDLIPGVDNVIEVDVTREGEWTGRCAEYCGFDHWLMKFEVRAVSPDEFDEWITEKAAEPQPVVAGAPTTTTPDGATTTTEGSP